MRKPFFTIYLNLEKNISFYKNLDTLMDVVANDMYNAFETLNPFVYYQDGKLGIEFDAGDKKLVREEITNIMGYFLDDEE